MKNILWGLLYIFSVIFIAGCSHDKKTDNPYVETHIVDVAPNYKITTNDKPTLNKTVNQMTEDELKTRYGELQQLSGLTPAQQEEFNLLSERLRKLSEYKLKTDQTISIIRK